MIRLVFRVEVKAIGAITFKEDGCVLQRFSPQLSWYLSVGHLSNIQFEQWAARQLVTSEIAIFYVENAKVCHPLYFMSNRKKYNGLHKKDQLSEKNHSC